jgi:hypothetical protein
MTDKHDNIFFGKEYTEKRINYRSGLQTNTCTPGKDDPDKECQKDVVPLVPIEHLNNCYEKIQEKSAGLYDNDQPINECISQLNEQLRCNGKGDYLRCGTQFNASKLKDSCSSQEDAMENIINYCVNRKDNPDLKICNSIYESSEFKRLDDTKPIKDLKTSQYACGDTCNLESIEKPDIKKYEYKNTLNSSTSELNCHEMSKLIFDCQKLKTELGDDSENFEQLYRDFIKDGKYDFNKPFQSDNSPIDSDKLDKLLKYGMCKIAADNIDIVTGAKIEQSLTDWWNYNIFNNKSINDDSDTTIQHTSGFQRNIFYVSFFIVLFLKLTILSKFNIMPGTTTYLNKILPILSILFSLLIFYGFVNKMDWIAKIAHITFVLFALAIIIGFGFYIKDKIWDSNKPVLGMLLIIGCIILFTKSISGVSDNNSFISISIILYFIFISIFFTLKSEKSTIIFKMLSILIICILLIVYLFYSKDLIFNTIYFYAIVFIIMIFIICANNTDMFYKKFNGSNSSKYLKIINVVLKPFGKGDVITKYLVLGCYFIFALADSFISVLSPQVSLVIMITFRLILNRWFEPINAMFSALSGYSMSNIEGTFESMSTTNKGVLDVDNLLSFFVR